MHQLYHLFQCSDYSALLDALGLFFQIRDDYANLSSQEVYVQVHHSLPSGYCH